MFTLSRKRIEDGFAGYIKAYTVSTPFQIVNTNIYEPDDLPSAVLEVGEDMPANPPYGVSYYVRPYPVSTGILVSILDGNAFVFPARYNSTHWYTVGGSLTLYYTRANHQQYLDDIAAVFGQRQLTFDFMN